MKRSNRKRQFLGRWISQSFVLGPLVFLMVAGAGCPSLFQSDGQRAVRIRQAVVGKDGDRTITAANTVVNTYAALYAGVNRNNNKITVRPTEDATFANSLAQGDLLLIIQMAGAAMDTTNTIDYGTVSSTNLGNAGHYEFASVESVTGNEITLTCLLKNDYTGPAGKTQVVRVPQYKTLTIQSANNASITAPAWDGTVGGVVAVHAETTLVLNGKIDVTAKGFRGGATDDNTGSTSTYRSPNDTDGADKGESIVGYGAEYNTRGGRYGRGAPANGGGGGDSHNAGGGGGANARHGVAWTGQGVMSTSVTGGAAAWPLDPNYAGRNSEGGGRGGYSYSENTADPTVTGPDDATAWGGDGRRQVGGLGGHPVDNNPASRLFVGGGGGAGDGNNGVAGRGGKGGGLVFIIAGSVTGTGSIVADGEAGANAADGTGGGDAAGGGGGGGTVVVHAVSVAGISIAADGGSGGLQTGTRTDTEGPGGGGGGGYIAVAGGTVTTSAKGGLGGTTSHAVMAKFPSNGATAGNDGQTDGDATGFLYCGMQSGANTPDTTIVTYPSSPSGSPRGTFTFSATEGAVTYECQIDATATNGWTDCTTPYTTPVLPDGEHTLYVRATDLSGNTDSTPASRAWTIIAGQLDGGVLDTTIATYPPDVSGSPVGTFTFTSNHPPVTYQCQLDGTVEANWTACTTPYTTPVLPDGSHTLYVRAIDLNGTKDATPASHTWTIVAGQLDGGVLDTTILTYPPDVSGSPVGTFTFTSNHPPVTYQCQIDGTAEAGWVTCTSPYTTPVLPDGDHTLYVRAIDTNGTKDTTPAQHPWKIVAGSIDGGVLDTTILTYPPAVSGSPVGTFTFGSNHPPVTFQCQIDGTAEAGWVNCTTPYTTPVLPDGDHTIYVRAIDVNGTKDSSPATYPWRVIAGQLDAGVLDAQAVDVAVKEDAPVVIADSRPLDAGIAIDATKAIDGADAFGPLLDATADLTPDTTAPKPEPGPDAAVPIVKEDAATPATEDAPVAGGTKPVLLGGGFCAVSPSRTSSPAAFALLALAALALIRRRRSR
jgi:MYXO-CTERM domain-containing protein